MKQKNQLLIVTLGLLFSGGTLSSGEKTKKEKKTWNFIKLKEKEKTRTCTFTIREGNKEREVTVRGTKDDRIATSHTGTQTITIDEFGELVMPRGDILFSVVRIHETKEENIYCESIFNLAGLDDPINRDSLEKSGEPAERIITDTYHWYEEGYRYPVFETVQSCRILKDRTLPLREATCVYAP